MCKNLSSRSVNNIYLGLCFVALFSAFSGLGSIQKTLSASIQQEDPSYRTDGYISLSIIYTTLSIGMWLAPGIIAKTGPKYAMVLGAFFNGIYMTAFYTENSFWIYLGAAVCGFGGSILWTGQANYIVLNSEVGKVHSGIGVFWILYQTSHFIGNTILYLIFGDIHRSLDRAMRVKIISMFVGFAGLATLMMCFIRPPLRNKEQKHVTRNPCTEIVKASKMITSPSMLLLLVTMSCVGMHLSFLSVLRACMGFTKYLSNNPKQLAPLCGLLEGCGEITGGILSIVLGGKKICSLKPMITVGCVSNLLCYILMFLALPDNAPHKYTNDLPIITLPVSLVLSGSIFAGIGDACFHTEMYDSIGAMYPNDSASAFAVFKFIRSIATASSFYYGKSHGLYAQLTLLMIFTGLSWILYHCVQWCLVTPQLDDEDDTKKIISSSS